MSFLAHHLNSPHMSSILAIMAWVDADAAGVLDECDVARQWFWFSIAQ